jgi:hypothetical protein
MLRIAIDFYTELDNEKHLDPMAGKKVLEVIT